VIDPATVGEIVLEVVLPAAGASGAVFYALVRWRGPGVAPAASAVALAAGFLIGNHLRGAVGLREDSVDLHRLLRAALAALCLGVVARWRRTPSAAGWAMRLAGAALATRVIHGLIDDSPVPAWQLAALLIVGWAVCEAACREPAGGNGAWALSMAAVAAAVVLLHAHTARLAEAAVLLSAALFGLGVVASCKGIDAGGAVPGGVVVLAGLLTVGQGSTYSDVPPRCFLLAGVPPLALAPTMLPWVRRLAGPRLGILRLALVAVPCAAAVAWAMRVESVGW